MQYREFRKIQRKLLRYLIIFLIVIALIAYHTALISDINELDVIALYKEYRVEKNDPFQACQLPMYHPFDLEVLPYFSNPRPIRCRSRVPVLTYIDSFGYIRRNKTAFAEAGYSVEGLSCSYQEITKVEGDDSNVWFGEEIPLTGNDKSRSDFVYVACKRFSWLPNVYSMFHAHAQKKPGIRPFKDDFEVGVAVVGLDSVSRLNFMRQLPWSYQVITENLDGVVLKGFNKVGENTLPNVVAMLTGDKPRMNKGRFTFDDWPFIWNELKKDNVATFYGEDNSAIMTFSWWGEGFRQDPTTHYFRTFWVAVDSSSLAALSSPFCLGSTPKHQIYLNYQKSFLRTYKNHPVFMFSLENEPSHDYMNTVGVMDKDLKDFLLSSYHENLFNRTILFVLSDHGHRFDAFRKTKQGKDEDRMPMVSIVVPKWFSNHYHLPMQNLRNNRKRLTSSFDLYSTFVDIFRGDSFRVADKTLGFREPIAGVSLFSPIALNRTCQDAGVPEMYCVCAEVSRTVKKDEDLAVASRRVVEEYINNEILQGNSSTWIRAINDRQNFSELDLSDLKKCVRLTVEIIDARLVERSSDQLVHLTFKTKPNDGLYEGRVLWPKGDAPRNAKIHEDVIRINRYGNQPNCLDRLLMTIVPFVRSVCLCP